MKKLSTFPQFEPLKLDHKYIIDEYTSAFLPYADYNFFSLWCYNVEEKITLCDLYGNLVIKFQDYTSDSLFYSFIGKNKTCETVSLLLEHAKKGDVLPVLKLIPAEIMSEKVISQLRHKYHVQEDIDNFDYILDISSVSSLLGRRLHQKRKMANKFYRQYNFRFDVESFNDPGLKEELVSVFSLWEKVSGKSDEEVKYEVRAIKRGLLSAEYFENVFCLRMFVDDVLRGFSVFELLDNEYIIGGFQKADINFKGIYEAINQQVAVYGSELLYKYINIENDMGIEGLRRAKLDYNPTYLKKYSISVK